MDLNTALVAIHAHVCGDGNMYVKKEKRSPSSIRTGRSTKPFDRYIIEYTNTDDHLLELMISDVKALLQKSYVYLSRKKHRIQVRSKSLFFSLRHLGYIDGNNWSIPEKVVQNETFRRIWLRAIFDDEGCVYKSSI